MKILVTGAKGFVGKTFVLNSIQLKTAKIEGTLNFLSKLFMNTILTILQKNLTGGVVIVISYSILQV